MARSTMTKLTIPSTLDEAVKVQRAIIDAAESCGYGEGAKFAIRLAVDEALSNAIVHGNHNDPAKKVHVEFSVHEESARISVTDEGPGFNPTAIPDPTLDENLDRPHGRGVMLMKAYMTSVSFSNDGNSVTLVKKRTCKLPRQ